LGSEYIYIVYKTTNIINNKYYVGVHRQNKNDLEFDGYYGSGMLLRSAINKYGKENFIRETLFVFDKENDAYDKEAEIVNETFIQKNMVYNLCVGGGHPPTLSGSENYMYGKTHTEEARKKISEKRKGKSVSNETKKKISDSMKGENHPLFGKYGKNHPNYGKRHSEETKLILREKNKGKIMSDESKAKMSMKAKERLKNKENHWNYGKHHSEETKQKISESQRGEKGNFYGKQHSEESKQKMKKPKIKVVCPYCGKIGGLPVMKRFHFDKCKHKINTTI